MICASIQDTIRRLTMANKQLTKMCDQYLAELAAERQRAKVLKDGIIAVSDLIDDSESVAGLHKNGDLAPWDELREGDRFEGGFQNSMRPSPPWSREDEAKALRGLLERARVHIDPCDENDFDLLSRIEEALGGKHD